MANSNDLGGVVAKELHIFYILDTSGSMNTSGKISALNDAMRSTVEELRDFNRKSPDATCKIAVMQFDNSARWITINSAGQPVMLEMDDFEWDDLTANGMTELGKALQELKENLTRDSLQKSDTGNKAPIIIFMSDGQPTGSWKPQLEELNRNGWYEAAIKIAFPLGDEADRDVLKEVIGYSPNKENTAIIETENLADFVNKLQVVSIQSVNVVSKGTSVNISNMNNPQKNSEPTPTPEPTPDDYPPIVFSQETYFE